MIVLPLSVHPSTPVERAAQMLVTNKISSLPVIQDGQLVGIITASDMLCALEAILGSATDGSVRIDVAMSAGGEMSAAIGLLRTVGPILFMGTYSRPTGGDQVLYLPVPASGVERAVHALERDKFKILSIHRSSGRQQELSVEPGPKCKETPEQQGSRELIKHMT